MPIHAVVITHDAIASRASRSLLGSGAGIAAGSESSHGDGNADAETEEPPSAPPKNTQKRQRPDEPRPIWQAGDAADGGRRVHQTPACENSCGESSLR